MSIKYIYIFLMYEAVRLVVCQNLKKILKKFPRKRKRSFFEKKKWELFEL